MEEGVIGGRYPQMCNSFLYVLCEDGFQNGPPVYYDETVLKCPLHTHTQLHVKLLKSE